MEPDQKLLFDLRYDEDGWRRWNNALLEVAPESLATNVRTRYTRVRAGGHELPVSVNDAEYDSSYVVSLYTSFITCFLARVDRLRFAPLRWAARTFFALYGAALKAGRINAVAFINNRLVPTNLHPPMTTDEVRAVTRELVAAHPDRLLIWRSLNRKTNPEFIDQLRTAGYVLLPIRQVFIFAPSENEFWKRHHTAKDVRKLKYSPYDTVSHDQFRPDDMPRIKQLYDMLYLEKYRSVNPEFTVGFFERAWRERWLTYLGLRDPKSGQLVGVAAFYVLNGKMTAPFLGYDTRQPPQEGLYRQMMCMLLTTCRRSERWYNASAGVSGFKMARGGEPQVEYYALYMKHLPLYRRLLIRILQAAAFGIGVPLLKIFRL